MGQPKLPERKKMETCGAVILYLTNGILLLVGLAGVAMAALVMSGQGGVTTISGIDATDLAEFVPKSFVYFTAGTCGLVVVVSFLGFVGTCCQMKENKLADKEAREKKESTVGGGLGGQGCCSKDACMSCALDLYIVFTFVGLLVLIAASAVGAAAIGGVTVDDVEATVTDACDSVNQDCQGVVTGILQSAFDYIDSWITDNKDGESWAAAQNVLKCCGWWVDDGGNVSAIPVDISEIHCCQDNATYVDQASLDIQLFSVTLSADLDTECNTDIDGNVYSCGGQIVDFMTSNVQSLSIGTWIFTFLTLVCFICACVVRCAIKPKKKKKKVADSAGGQTV